MEISVVLATVLTADVECQQSMPEYATSFKREECQSPPTSKTAEKGNGRYILSRKKGGKMGNMETGINRIDNNLFSHSNTRAHKF